MTTLTLILIGLGAIVVSSVGLKGFLQLLVMILVGYGVGTLMGILLGVTL